MGNVMLSEESYFIPFISIRPTIKKQRPQQSRLQYFKVYVDS